MIAKVLGRITPNGQKLSYRNAPVQRVRLANQDIVRDSGTIERPLNERKNIWTPRSRKEERTNGDAVLIPFHGKHAAPLSVEIRAIGSTTPLRYSTTHIRSLGAITVSGILSIGLLIGYSVTRARF
jgi:hypothetical protein